MTTKASYYRSGLVSLLKLLKKNRITRAHIEAARNTPFYMLLKTTFKFRNVAELPRKKFYSIIQYVVERFSFDEDAFLIGSKFVKLTTGDVKVIFGLKHDTKEISLMKAGAFHNRYVNDKENEPRMMKKYFMGQTSKKIGPTNTKTITNAILKAGVERAISEGREHELEEVARLLILFSCSNLFYSVSRDILGWNVLYFVEDLSKINDYDWFRSIVFKLFQSIRSCLAIEKPDRVVGCVALLIADEVGYKFDKQAPPLAKQVVSKVHAFFHTASEKAQKFVSEAQTEGPRIALHYASSEYKQFVLTYSVYAWIKLNEYPTIHGLAKKAEPAAAKVSHKYNETVNDMIQKGYPIFGYLPRVPVEEIENAFKKSETKKKGKVAKKKKS